VAKPQQKRHSYAAYQRWQKRHATKRSNNSAYQHGGTNTTQQHTLATQHVNTGELLAQKWRDIPLLEGRTPSIAGMERRQCIMAAWREPAQGCRHATGPPTKSVAARRTKVVCVWWFLNFIFFHFLKIPDERCPCFVFSKF